MSLPQTSTSQRLQQIKELAVMGMFSDDEMMDVLVLKGANALDLIYRISTRASVDVDLSMPEDFPGGPDALLKKAETALTATYRDGGYLAFDFKLEEKPKVVSEDLRAFWGGYRITFKLLTLDAAKVMTDFDERRRNAINLGHGTNFEVDISRFEFVAPKMTTNLQGIRVFVYSPAMLAAEKLRALCQQTQEYGELVHRTRPGTSRAKDFVDIHLIATECGVDIASSENRDLLRQVFGAKHVPIALLFKLAESREFHKASFRAVQDTVRPGVVLQPFGFYFQFVLDLVEKLKSAGDM